MHEDEIASDEGLVLRLVREQFPQHAHLPVARVTSTGTDNALYRLGVELVARLPLRPAAVPPIAREHRWLPVLAPHLPVAVPVVVAVGEPAPEFPWPWSVHRWLDGTDATAASLDPVAAVADLAGFLVALQAVDATDGPGPAAANFGRGAPLTTRDDATRAAIAEARDLVDAGAVTRAWDEALAVPGGEGPGVWVHGDVAAGNLLVRAGRLAAVIDWECLAVGDPAVDLLVAWELFGERDRSAFRDALGVDDETWARGRGWALSTALVALPYYRDTNAFMADQARRKIAAVLADGA